MSSTSPPIAQANACLPDNLGRCGSGWLSRQSRSGEQTSPSNDTFSWKRLLNRGVIKPLGCQPAAVGHPLYRLDPDKKNSIFQQSLAGKTAATFALGNVVENTLRRLEPRLKEIDVKLGVQASRVDEITLTASKANSVAEFASRLVAIERDVRELQELIKPADGS